MNQVGQIYLASLLILSICTFVCIKNQKCRYAEPLLYFTQFYVFIGLLVFMIIWFFQIYKNFS
jgi:hypothetical protein